MSGMTTTAPTTAALHGIGRALVIGLGASGLAAARLLAGQDVDVTIVDDAADHPGADRARAHGFTVIMGRPAAEVLDATVDLVVPSPGVPEGAAVLVAAGTTGIPVWSEPELGLRVFPHPLVAVTGTNGKTSTTELVAAMFAAADVPAIACGNIGRPLSDAASSTAPDTVLVAELSSFQLRFVHTLRARAAVVLNVADDHLDWHGDADSYGQAKARIWIGQHPDDWAIANADDPTSTDLRDRHAAGRHASFSATHPVPIGVGRQDASLVMAHPDGATRAVVPLADLSSQAPHHVSNVAAAATVAILAGLEASAVADAARAYHAGDHRFQTIAVVDDVTYVNDSKATNVHATSAALDAAPDIVWIAGGLSKGVELRPLGEHLQHVRAGVFIGTAADELASICARAGVPAHRSDSIEAAVAIAAELAEPGTTVLLAPACASFDQFRDYAERGARFGAAVRMLADARRAAAGRADAGDSGDRTAR